MAAVVFIPPSPHDPLANMATSARRAPLANISNATQSPHRLLTNSGSKRSRTAAGCVQQENEPPLKRQALEKDEGSTVTPRRRPRPTAAESKVFERGTAAEVTTNAFQRRLAAARDRTASAKLAKAVEQPSRDVEKVRQWQKHYMKLFPSFSFYFDSVPDEVRARFVRHITNFGAKEEKFFSKSVTHIVTTRAIPTDNGLTKSNTIPSPTDTLVMDEQTQTINPSLLERHATSRSFGANMRRDTSASMDILTRGRQMGMKIYPVEKLQQMLSTMLEDPYALSQSRGHAVQASRNQDDLSQVLRNEKIGTTAEREQVSMPRETIPFRGPFVYIHDMEEKFRPTMIREYPKVARRQDGEWPQFRSATIGKCPFVEDPALKKEVQERAKQKAMLAQQQAKDSQTALQPRTTLAATATDLKMEPPRRTSPRKALQEVRNPAAAIIPQQHTPMPMPAKLERHSSFPPMPEQPPVGFLRPAQMHLIREPAASGMQRSNMTSAIQSQMISSTAATGAKTGTSKEVHELKRKVLEGNHTNSLSMGSIPSSHRMTDLAGALKNARATGPQRVAKCKAQEKLGGIQEDLDPYADDIAAERALQLAAKKKKATKKDPKPGYCENCRDKYEDFEEHIISRKHRKFAMTQSNWAELDTLLRKLQAP